MGGSGPTTKPPAASGTRPQLEASQASEIKSSRSDDCSTGRYGPGQLFRRHQIQPAVRVVVQGDRHRHRCRSALRRPDEPGHWKAGAERGAECEPAGFGSERLPSRGHCYERFLRTVQHRSSPRYVHARVHRPKLGHHNGWPEREPRLHDGRCLKSFNSPTSVGSTGLQPIPAPPRQHRVG
jgi:hypothetical protein